MITKIIDKSFIINNVPLDEIIVEKNTVTIDFDDVNEQRYKIKFTKYQSVKITKADWFDKDILLTSETLESGRYQRYILEIENSEWIEQLKKILKENDENANFMEQSRHFIIDLRDKIIEIVANDFELSQVKN